MRNLVYRVGPKTPDLPSSGHGPKFLGCNCNAAKHYYLLGSSHNVIARPGASKEIKNSYLVLGFTQIASQRHPLTSRMATYCFHVASHVAMQGQPQARMDAMTLWLTS